MSHCSNSSAVHVTLAFKYSTCNLLWRHSKNFFPFYVRNSDCCRSFELHWLLDPSRSSRHLSALVLFGGRLFSISYDCRSFRKLFILVRFLDGCLSMNHMHFHSGCKNEDYLSRCSGYRLIPPSSLKSRMNSSFFFKCFKLIATWNGTLPYFLSCFPPINI